MSSKFAGSDGEQVQFAKDFEELADLEEFLEYQDQLHLEEAARVRSLPVLMVSKSNLRKTLKSLLILKSFWSIRISCT